MKKPTNPIADKSAVIKGEKYRFTVLTDRLIRLEYAEDGVFEDRATQTVINRLFPVPKFTVSENDGTLKIETDCVRLIYRGGPFSRNSLSASFCGRLGKLHGRWYYGDEIQTLPGTSRTLDGASGSIDLQGSIMNNNSFAVMDDSHTLAITDENWVDVRKDDCIDIYLFAYPGQYKDCLCDYYTLTGAPPLLPRFALGNWWSRYHKYSDAEYRELMERFKSEEIPVSVAVIDMDWHKVDIDPKYGTGWTGFSWEKSLFPNPKSFIEYLHENDMKVSLNLHPAEGISAHEDCYEEAAKAMGADISKEENIPFDIADSKFVGVYFDKVLRPLEDDGVDFWWIDWQQGNTSKLPGLDPLWMLNHFHYLDSMKDNRRGLLFSRFSGFGSHRYPIGFSGDTIINWESLDFQPYFTACASNVGYGWWSHDIGGHMRGYRDDELESRWTQLGAFSPILRLHCSYNEFISREPWSYNHETYLSMKKFLRLRYELIPYLYSMNYRAHSGCLPLITPLYYDYPELPEAYKHGNEYFFGSELLVCPITRKHDEVTGMGSTEMYIPEGLWFDFFNKYSYSGNRTLKMFRKYDEMPVLAKAGAIIPMCGINGNSTDNPEELIFNIFPGANNSFTVYEDDGKTRSYENGDCVKTTVTLNWGDKKTITVSKPEGNISLIPDNRKYKIILNCVNDVGLSSDADIEKSYKNGAIEITSDCADGFSVCFEEGLRISDNDYVDKVYDILYEAHTFYETKKEIYDAVKTKNLREAISDIYAMDIDINLKDAILEVLL